jgi:3-oxoacyl-[acyl-carrier-protein] synthase II
MNNVAITGLGVVSSLGLEVGQFFKKLSAAHVAVGPAPWAGEEGLPYAWISMVGGFDPLDWMDERVANGTDPFAQYAMAAAVQAIDDCGIRALDPLRTGVVMGTSMAGVETLVDAQHGLDTQGPPGVSRKLQLKAWSNMAAGHIALRWQLHGPLLTVSTACASSLDALGIAARMIESGQCDVAIAGGTDSARSKVTLMAAGMYGMFKSQPDPYRACLPFDVHRVGIMGGEGAGVVILERADRAAARGAKVYGRIRGYASLSDGTHPTSPEPQGKWERRTMELAIQEAALPNGPAEVDALIAHGTGTPVGDTAEIRAINGLFTDRDEPLAVCSIKGHVGHTAGAAGVMNLMAALHSMRQQALVPTAGTTDVDPEAQFQVVIREPAKRRIDTMQVNGFGFGGQDASLVISRE